jgi:glycerol-3-phosphate acyltransferase PlsY
MAAIAFALIWLSTAALTRYSSLAGLLASAAMAPVLALMGLPREALLFVALTVLVWIMHRGNIRRLLSGTESKIGSKA